MRVEIMGEGWLRDDNGFPVIRIAQQVGHHAIACAGVTRIIHRSHPHGIRAFFPGRFYDLCRLRISRSAAHREMAGTDEDGSHHGAGPGNGHVLGINRNGITRRLGRSGGQVGLIRQHSRAARQQQSGKEKQRQRTDWRGLLEVCSRKLNFNLIRHLAQTDLTQRREAAKSQSDRNPNGI